MKVLVRDDQTRAYLGHLGKWVTDKSQAKDFGTLQSAGEEARQSSRQPCSVVLSYDDPPCELAINPTFCVQ